MGEMDVAQFAGELGLQVELLLDQLVAAGMSKQHASDSISEQDKVQLLQYLRSAYGSVRCKGQITLTQRGAPEINNSVSADKHRKIPVEVLKKHEAESVPSGLAALPESHLQPNGFSKINSLAEQFAIGSHTSQLSKDRIASIAMEELADYTWPGLLKPFRHQMKTTEFLVSNNRAFCLNDMGTGKTMSVLWAFDCLKKAGLVNRMLVVAPLSTLTQTWAESITKNLKHLSFTVLHGSGEQRRYLLKRDVDIYIINHDGMKIIVDALASRIDIDVIVIDEIAQVARNKGTQRWNVLRKIVPHPHRWCWGLTGTPTPNAPTDAWAQCLLVNPDTVPKYFGAFQDLTMKTIGPNKKVARSTATGVVAKAMQPSIRYKREECIDLPPVTYETRTVDLTEAQKKMYREMLLEFHAEFDGKEIDAVNEAVKIMKLVQIATGAVYDQDGDAVIVHARSRLIETKAIIEEAGSKVIVFVPFTSSLEYLAEYLKQNFSVAKIHGSVTQLARDHIFHDFQNSPEPRVIVANPKAMSHGLTLTAASVIVWFAPIYSLEVYEQACARITRPGQKLHQLIVRLEGSPVESAIYNRLDNKSRMQGLLLELFQTMRRT